MEKRERIPGLGIQHGKSLLVYQRNHLSGKALSDWYEKMKFCLEC